MTKIRKLLCKLNNIDLPPLLSLLNFDPLLHLLQSVSPLQMPERVGGCRLRRPLVRPRRDAVGLQDGAGRGHQAVPRAKAGRQRGGGSRRSAGRRSGHGSRRRRVVRQREGGGGWRSGWKGALFVRFQRGGAHVALQGDAAGVLVEAAELLCVTVDGLQQNFVDNCFCGLRVDSLHLLVIHVVRLRNSLLQQRGDFVNRSVEKETRGQIIVNNSMGLYKNTHSSNVQILMVFIVWDNVWKSSRGMNTYSKAPLMIKKIWLI